MLCHHHARNCLTQEKLFQEVLFHKQVVPPTSVRDTLLFPGCLRSTSQSGALGLSTSALLPFGGWRGCLVHRGQLAASSQWWHSGVPQTLSNIAMEWGDQTPPAENPLSRYNITPPEFSSCKILRVSGWIQKQKTLGRYLQVKVANALRNAGLKPWRRPPFPLASNAAKLSLPL